MFESCKIVAESPATPRAHFSGLTILLVAPFFRARPGHFVGDGRSLVVGQSQKSSCTPVITEQPQVIVAPPPSRLKYCTRPHSGTPQPPTPRRRRRRMATRRRRSPKSLCHPLPPGLKYCTRPDCLSATIVIQSPKSLYNPSVKINNTEIQHSSWRLGRS